MKSSKVGWAADVAQVAEFGNVYKMYMMGQYDMERSWHSWLRHCATSREVDS
jgi:hypothetical protein